jgi:hypothetical protein
MPYEGEYAHYQPLKRIVESERVKQLLKKSQVLDKSSAIYAVQPQKAPQANGEYPSFILAIDGSNAEVDVRNGYPGAKVGYCSVASVLLNLEEIERLDKCRPANPAEFRKVESPSSDAAALPGCNVITRNNESSKDSFRESVFELFHDNFIDDEDKTNLLETFEVLLGHKPTDTIKCPYDHNDCDEHVKITNEMTKCHCQKRKTLYPTDSLRIHERFYEDSGSNAEAFGYVLSVWEKILLIHLLRCFEKRDWLDRMNSIAFFLDGPLAVFGPPAWLSTSITHELKRLNMKVREKTGNDLIIVGIEKSGNFVAHFEEIDKKEDGSQYFQPGSYFLPTDKYIKERIIFSNSEKRYGADTYFGRKFFYKTQSGAQIVACIPFLNDEQDTLDIDDFEIYSQFGTICSLLDKLVTSRYPNALAPIVSAHAQASIPLHLGQKVLKQLAQALVRK